MSFREELLRDRMLRIKDSLGLRVRLEMPNNKDKEESIKLSRLVREELTKSNRLDKVRQGTFNSRDRGSNNRDRMELIKHNRPETEVSIR